MTNRRKPNHENRRCSELGEDLVLEKLLGRIHRRSDSVVLGAGDDCAVVRRLRPDHLLLLKTDCLVEGIHFSARTPPAQVGWKAMARPLSDFAAMSGLPQFALVTLIVPGSKKLAWVDGVYRGLLQVGNRFDVAIVGGETSATRGPVVLSISVAGSVEKARWVSRSGGEVDDELFVTGRLGGAIRGKHLRFIPRIEEARWLTRNFSIHAMMDLSDGLGTDLPRLARASRLGFELDRKAIPRTAGCSLREALTGGEDYELLFAVSSRGGVRLPERWRKRFPRLPLTRIGRLKAEGGSSISRLPRGYVHFQ